MLRTCVGYSGGTRDQPTYHSLGDHSEAIRIEYDPSRMTYEKLLEVFWSSHNPCWGGGSRQYRSAIFYHSEEQKKLALAAKKREESKRERTVHTEIAAAGPFYPAEDYHQKYLLQQNDSLMGVFREFCPRTGEFVASTAAARVNGFLGGHVQAEALEKEIEGWGLTMAQARVLLDALHRVK
ncbi:MAG: peptide-methionine (S)-S-oxide reductase [Planctomycetes bacterium]|nr:peptide-methionine (S)-S-oxide reductase [Planctomycetota bacterium]